MNSAPVPSDVDCQLPPALQMLPLEISVDQINESLFPVTVPSSDGSTPHVFAFGFGSKRPMMQGLGNLASVLG